MKKPIVLLLNIVVLASTDTPPAPAPQSEPNSSEPDACVSLLVYADQDCSGPPLRSLTFPTGSKSKEGSPCYHDATMSHYSVKNQRCDLESGTWHQDVYVLSDSCEVKWYTKLFSPQFQVFSSDRCLYGMKLDYCVAGPCPTNDTDADDEATNVVSEESTRMK